MMKKGLFFTLLILFFAASLFAVGEIEHGGDVIFTGDEAKLFFYNGIYYSSFRASGSLAGNYNFIWPINDGTSGQTLITDGSGALSFADVNAVAGIHTVLSITHQDSTTSAITAGDIVFSNATPKWDDLAIGASNEVLRVSGGLPDWQATTFITETGALTYVDGTLALASGSITDTGGTIAFGNENLTTTGAIQTGKITATKTTQQLELEYDGSNQADFTVSSSGDLTITASGGDITFGNESLVTTGNFSAEVITGESVEASGLITADSFITGGDIGVAGDTNILQLAADALTVNGTLGVGAITSTGNLGVTGTITATSHIKTDGNIQLKDPGAAFYLKIATSFQSITADRNLNIDVGDATRTLTFSGNPTLADWFDQSVKVADSPTFVGLTLSGAIATPTTITASGLITGGSFVTGGDIGVAGDTDLLQSTANLLTVNGAITATGTVQAEHLYSTDDAQIDAYLQVDGAISIGDDAFEPGGGTSGHVLNLVDTNPSIRMDIWRDSVSGLAFNFFDLNAKSLDEGTGTGLSDQIGVVGIYGDFDAGVDNKPYGKYIYMGAGNDTAYNAAFIKIDAGDKLALGLSSNTRPTTAMLEVYGTALIADKLAFTQTDLNEYIDSLADGYMDYGATTAHRFNTDKLVVLASGNVGIGTNAPDSIFHIKANVAGTVGSHPAGQLIIQDPDDTVFGNAVITGYESDGAGNPDQQLWYLGSSSSSNSAIIFLNRRNSKLQLGTNGVSRLTILGNGNVGIGTPTPTAALQMGDDKLIAVDTNAGLTASTTQSQGQGALTAQVNEISTVANDDDTVTLPTAVTGIEIEIINNGANTLLIFPASGDNLGLGVDAAEELEANERVKFVAYDTTNWAKESSTEIIHAEIHDEDNTDAFVINDAGGDFHSYHTNGLAAGDLADWTFDAGGAGTSFPIASIADGADSGVDIEVTTTGNHLLAVGDIISQTNLADAAYVGIFDVKAIISATQYEVAAVYTADGTGTMDQAATLEADAVAAGVYAFAYYISGTLVGNNETFDFQLYKEATVVTGSKIRRKFGSANDFGSMSGGGVGSIVSGDKISFALSNENSAANIILRNLTIVLIRL